MPPLFGTAGVITRRTIFFHRDGENLVPGPWALVTTSTSGNMIEPWSNWGGWEVDGILDSHDRNDDFCLVTDTQQIPYSSRDLIFGVEPDTGVPLHGGRMALV